MTSKLPIQDINEKQPGFLGKIGMEFMLAELIHEQATRCVFNAKFNQAVLFFKDGSYLQFEHTSRDNRWARASAEETLADNICQSLRQFRLNAKHLQLFFEDGTNIEFIVSASSQKSKGKHGSTR